MRTSAVLNRPESMAAGTGRGQRTEAGSTAGSWEQSTLPAAPAAGWAGLSAEQHPPQKEVVERREAPTRKVTVRKRPALVDMLFLIILLFGQFSTLPQIFSVAYAE